MRDHWKSAEGKERKSAWAAFGRDYENESIDNKEQIYVEREQERRVCFSPWAGRAFGCEKGRGSFEMENVGSGQGPWRDSEQQGEADDSRS